MPFPKHVNKQIKNHKDIQNHDSEESQKKYKQVIIPRKIENFENYANFILTGIFSNQSTLKCAIVKNNNFTHIFSGIKTDLIVENTQGKIKIKSDHPLYCNDYSYKIVNGDITIFDVDSATMYSGIILVENNKLHFKFTNRPIIPLCLNLNAILQFNIYIL